MTEIQGNQFWFELARVRVIGSQLYGRFLAKAGDMREARASTSACLARIEPHMSVLKIVKKRKTIH